jgi:hypothetical protein
VARDEARVVAVIEPLAAAARVIVPTCGFGESDVSPDGS